LGQKSKKKHRWDNWNRILQAECPHKRCDVLTLAEISSLSAPADCATGRILACEKRTAFIPSFLLIDQPRVTVEKEGQL